MVETLILAMLLGFCSGFIGGMITKKINSKILKTKQLTITCINSDTTEWVVIKDKNGNDILSFSTPKDKLDINYLNYVKY